MGLKQLPFKSNSLLFAPMEGITDSLYRLAVMELFPEWSRYSTDFLRIPGQGKYPIKHYLEHLGEKVYSSPDLLSKTSFQILTTEKANTLEALHDLKSLKIPHIDLNLGCPSKTVNSHFGGAYLLSDLSALKNVLSLIRKNWDGIFTVKIRVGYRDDSQFENILKMIEDEGVDAVTIHGRTRDQLYHGRANWDYTKRAVKIVKIPVIGNGDVWSGEDVIKCFEYTGCHSIMLGRSAMKTPWMPLVLEDPKNHLELRKKLLPKYYSFLANTFAQNDLNEVTILKRLKSLSRNTVEDFSEGDKWRSQMLRSATLQDFFHILFECIQGNSEAMQSYQN